MLENGPALLGMPHCEWLMLLTVNCQTTDDPCRKLKTKNHNKDNLCTNHKANPEAGYFDTGTCMETDSATSANTTTKIFNEFSDMFTGIGCFNWHLLIQIKNDAKPYQVHHNMYYMHYKSHLERFRKTIRTADSGATSGR